jgi:RNA polymerase sigma-70 factor, ECF subfamily
MRFQGQSGDEPPEKAVEPLSPRDARFQVAWVADRRYLLAVAAGMLKRPDDAEDVVQEAFARLAASPDAIDDVRGWLVVVTRRLCLDRLDLAESRRTTATSEPPETPGGVPDPADRVLVRQGEEIVAVVRLDDRDGRIFHLHTVAFPSLAR